MKPNRQIAAVVLALHAAGVASCNGSSGEARSDAAALDVATGNTDATTPSRDSGAADGPRDATRPSDGSTQSACDGDGTCPDAEAGTGCPAAPSPAAAAGFTTCAQNFDFSLPSYADTTTWLDCTGNTDPSLPWHAGVPGLIPQNVGGPPCAGNVKVASDPTAGKNVLELIWLQSFATTYACAAKGIGCSVSIQTAMDGTNGINPGALTASYPVGIYVETMTRISTSYASTPSFLDDSAVWLWQAPSTGRFTTGQAAIENDVVELTASGGGYGVDGIHNWGTSTGTSGSDYSYSTWTSYAPNNTHVPAGWSPTAYHKYGYLITSDGGTHIYACEWIDDVFQTCGDSEALSYQYDDRNFLVTTIQGGGFSGTDYAQADITSYVEYIRVYSCADWASSQCNGSALVNGPPPSLTYWK